MPFYMMPVISLLNFQWHEREINPLAARVGDVLQNVIKTIDASEYRIFFSKTKKNKNKKKMKC